MDKLAAERKAFAEASARDKAKKIVTAVALVSPVALAAVAASKLKNRFFKKR
jgi:hypothetical protein